jgi:hypothetical protein
VPDESVTATRTEHGIRITGVRGYLGYTNVVTLSDDDALTLITWLRRDGNSAGANVIEQVLHG